MRVQPMDLRVRAANPFCHIFVTIGVLGPSSKVRCVENPEGFGVARAQKNRRVRRVMNMGWCKKGAVKGASLLEYGMLLGLLAVVAIVSVVALGQGNSRAFEGANVALRTGLESAGLLMGVDGEAENATDPACYERASVGTVGLASWRGCAGALIVDDALLRTAASAEVGGDESYRLTGPDGATYTFAQGERTIFTGQVMSLNFMFHNTTFNGNINHWDTSNVVQMTRTFSNNPVFNQPLDGWDISRVTSLNFAFEYASAFNQPLNSWNTSRVDRMGNVFRGAVAFNQPIGAWDVSNVTNFNFMFQDAHAFNQPLNTWRTTSAQLMHNMFRFAYAFNQPLDDWDTSGVTGMSAMFHTASAFAQDLSGWCVPNVTEAPHLFDQSAVAWTPTNVGRPVWGTCPSG